MKPSELAQRWRGNLRYLKKVIEAMPENQLDYRPGLGAKTFIGNISHLATWLRTHSRFATGLPMLRASTKTRNEAIAALDEFEAHLQEWLSTVSDDKLAEPVTVFYGNRSRTFILTTMENHLAHHRGILVACLRGCDIEPPGYVGW